jgi:tRNA-dihydrouridine synthase B
MRFLEEERPFGIQIYGGQESSMGGAARMAEELSPDLIDINCGCWVKNIANSGAGAGLLKDLPRMERIIRAVIGAVSVPVTVKTRLGWDTNSINIVETAKMIEGTGAQALTIHCRTRAAGHSGDPDYSWVAKVKEAVKIPIIVNGSINSPEIAKRVFDETGCDGVMVARAAINNPWIFQHIRHYLSTGTLLPDPSFVDRMRALRDHLETSVVYKGEQRAILEFRKHYAGYLHGQPGIAKLRAEMMQYTELAPILEALERYTEARERGLVPAEAGTIAA